MSENYYEYRDGADDGFDIREGSAGGLRWYLKMPTGSAYFAMEPDDVRDLRNQLTKWLQDNGHEDVPQAAEATLSDAWPELPKDAPDGVQVRYKVVPGGVRRGGAEPKVVVAETEQFVVYRVWSSYGRDLGERCMPRGDFEAEFERCPDKDVAHVKAFHEGLNKLTRDIGIQIAALHDENIWLIDAGTHLMQGEITGFTRDDGYILRMEP